MLTKWVFVGVVKAEVLSLTYAHIQTAQAAEVPIGPHMPVNVCIGARIYASCTVCKFAKIVQGTCNVPVVHVACTLYNVQGARIAAYAGECLRYLWVCTECSTGLQYKVYLDCTHKMPAYAGECLRYAKCNSRRRPMHLFICCSQTTSHLPDIDNILQGVPKQSYCSSVALKL